MSNIFTLMSPQAVSFASKQLNSFTNLVPAYYVCTATHMFILDLASLAKQGADYIEHPANNNTECWFL